MYHQEDGTLASKPSPPDCSTALSPRLNSNRPSPLWNPIQPHTLNPPPPPPQHYHITGKKLLNFFCAIQSVLHRWVGLYKPPVVTHCPLFTLETFHTLQCVHNPTKDSCNICMFTCSCTKIYLTLIPSQLLDSQYFLCTCTVFAKHLSSLYFFLFMHR